MKLYQEALNKQKNTLGLSLSWFLIDFLEHEKLKGSFSRKTRSEQ